MYLGFGIGLLVVVAILVGWILFLVLKIGKYAPMIDEALRLPFWWLAERTTLIPKTADGVDAVLAEGLQHHLFLGRVYEKVKT